MKKLIISISLFFFTLFSYSQNIGIGTTYPDSSAALEVKSSSQGFLPPRMTTTQRNSIANPAEGLQIFNTTTKCLQIYAYGYWQNIYCAQPSNQNNTSIVTDIDGNIYDTVRICNQTWTAKNINVSRYRNGDIIPQVTDAAQWASLTTGAWCWYNNDSANYGATYGKLYNWYAVNDPRGLAPQGWHVPSDGEWNKLVKYLDVVADTSCLGNCLQSSIAGGAMKSINGWEGLNSGATNSSGFSGLPGGCRNAVGQFYGSGNYSNWWSSTDFSASGAWFRNLDYNNTLVNKGGGTKGFGFSVRCVRD